MEHGTTLALPTITLAMIKKRKSHNEEVARGDYFDSRCKLGSLSSFQPTTLSIFGGIMRQGTRKTLCIDGVLIDSEYIGQGLFCKAYRYGDKVYLLCKGDYSKECISLFCDKERKHIPHIDRHAKVKDYQVFSMPFYHKLTKLNYPQAYKDWKTLPSNIRSYAEACLFVDSEQHNCPESLREAIRELIDAFSNYDVDTMLLEFNRANISVNDNGELILRDCLASIKSIEAVRKEKQGKRKQRNY